MTPIKDNPNIAHLTEFSVSPRIITPPNASKKGVIAPIIMQAENNDFVNPFNLR